MRTPPRGRRRAWRLLATAVALAAVASLHPAPALAATPPPPTAAHGGAVLDGYGGIHPFGGLSLDTAGAPYWSGWDIARSLVVLPDGSGGWELDGWGGIHAFGSAPAIQSPVYWPGWDIARAMVASSVNANGIPDGRQGYVLDGYGVLHPWGGAPSIGTPPYTPGRDIARGLELHYDGQGVPDGGWVLDVDGSIHAFGAAPAVSGSVSPTASIWEALHAADGVLYAVPKWGQISALGQGLAPYWDGYTDWGSWDILRDIVLVNPTNPVAEAQPVSAAATSALTWASRAHGGATLDGFGGIHPFGGLSLNTAGAPYWAGHDVARALVLREDGSGGWVLDAYGGIHAFGSAPPIQSPVSWPGWDIARAIVVTSHDANGISDGRQGYVLDGFGGIHPFGGAPVLTGNPYWPGWDIARGLEIHDNAQGVPDGGWILDGWGGIHPFGAAPPLTSPGDYLPGRDLALKLHVTGGTPYIVQRYGAVRAPASLAPSWAGYSDWGSWDILRDTVLLNPADPSPSAQPVSYAAAVAWRMHADDYTMWAPDITQSHALDCEAAALTAALGARGVSVSQDWVLGKIGDDARQPVRSGNGTIIRWGDPYVTFVGDVDGSEPNDTGYGVYQAPIAAAARAAGRPAVGASGWDPWALLDQVALGHPAVIWTDTSFEWVPMHQWVAWDGTVVNYAIGEHAVTVVGVNALAGTMTLLDVADGQFKTFSIAQFFSFFSSFGDMAVVVS